MEPGSSPALPEAFREKYLVVRRAHNQRALLLLVVVTLLGQGAGFGTRGSVPDRKNEVLAVMLGGMLGVVMVGCYRVWRLDRQQCAALGLWCPHCQKPLYRVHYNVLETGLCPHCRQAIKAEG